MQAARSAVNLWRDPAAARVMRRHRLGGRGRGRPVAGRGSGPARPDSVALGYEIFNREWLPDDPRGHGGDGLGPVYNDTSCVACHNAGGSGGARAGEQEHRHPQRRRGTAGHGAPTPAQDDPQRSNGRGLLTDDSQPPADARPARRSHADWPCSTPRRVPDEPDRRPAQVRHRPELRCLAAPGPSTRRRMPGRERRTGLQASDRPQVSGPAGKSRASRNSVMQRRECAQASRPSSTPGRPRAMAPDAAGPGLDVRERPALRRPDRRRAAFLVHRGPSAIRRRCSASA